ncbi:H-NS family nucleoid-associated regulatory protein [Stenotrophomonas maltophilia]|uniref:H-NS family nucleoid-associated regulatory protein n=1 Tax=Stenotrophomonas maltophilia TaxID=40324 RepID=UPI000C15049C
MVEKKSNLSAIAAQKQKLLEELKKLEQQEHDERKSEAESAYTNIIGLLEEFGPFFELKQRNEIVRQAGGSKKITSNNTARAEVLPKFQLPSGETWTGRGRTPTAFVAWAESEKGKKWIEANPDQKWPPIKN